jgi:hypothetical protein
MELKSQINQRREYKAPEKPKQVNKRSSLEILASLQNNLANNNGLASKEERKRKRNQYW